MKIGRILELEDHMRYTGCFDPTLGFHFVGDHKILLSLFPAPPTNHLSPYIFPV